MCGIEREKRSIEAGSFVLTCFGLGAGRTSLPKIPLRVESTKSHLDSLIPME